MTIADAIGQRRLLSFTYHDRVRIVEPHTYGVDAKGRKVLVAFQVDGDASEPLPGWRTFREKQMEDVEMLEQRFYCARAGYRYGDGLFRSIIAQLPALKD